MPKGSAVAKVEAKLKKEYPGNKRAVYGTLNNIGLMHGNKPTAKGLEKAKIKPRKVTASSKPKNRTADYSEGNPSQAIGSSKPARKR